MNGCKCKRGNDGKRTDDKKCKSCLEFQAFLRGGEYQEDLGFDFDLDADEFVGDGYMQSQWDW